MQLFDAELQRTVWRHKGTAGNQQGLAPDSMLTSLQITLINDNSEWKRPFVLDKPQRSM